MNAPQRPLLELSGQARRPRRRALRITGVVITGGLALVAASCSSGTTTNAGPATSTPAVSASSEKGTSTSSARSGTTTGSTATPGSARGTSTTARRSGTTSTSDPNVLTPPSIVVKATPGNEEFCTKVATALQQLTAAALESLGGSGTGEDLLPRVKALYADLAQTAPPAVKDDVQVVSDKLQKITQLRDLDQLGQDPEAAAAGERFGAWIKTECGFDPNNP